MLLFNRSMKKAYPPWMPRTSRRSSHIGTVVTGSTAYPAILELLRVDHLVRGVSYNLTATLCTERKKILHSTLRNCSDGDLSDLTPYNTSPSLSQLLSWSGYRGCMERDDIKERRRQHVQVLMTSNSNENIMNTFSLFPKLFKELRCKTLTINKDECQFLARTESPNVGQMGVLAGVPDCPYVWCDFASSKIPDSPRKLEIQENVENYVNKKDSTMEAHQKLLSLSEQKNRSNNLESDQVDLCRFMYKLNIQQLLLLESYNKHRHQQQLHQLHQHHPTPPDAPTPPPGEMTPPPGDITHQVSMTPPPSCGTTPRYTPPPPLIVPEVTPTVVEEVEEEARDVENAETSLPDNSPEAQTLRNTSMNRLSETPMAPVDAEAAKVVMNRGTLPKDIDLHVKQYKDSKFICYGFYNNKNWGSFKLSSKPIEYNDSEQTLFQKYLQH